MQVPFIDFKAQYAALHDELMPALFAVMESRQFINGEPIAELERAIATRCDCAEAIGVSSGTDALLCALMALDIGHGDEVITTPYTFFATAGSVWRLGARPIFVDIEPDTFNIDPTRIAAAVTEKTKAIIPVHLYGQVADMDAIISIASEHDLHVVEDACQAIGAASNGRKAGAMGAVGCFSFYPTKNLGGIGDGGMIVTQDTDLAEKIRCLRNHGQSGTYVHKWIGGNFRLDTLNAAALVVKLKYLDDWSRRRRSHAARYDELFGNCADVITPVVREGNFVIYNQYVIRVPRRDELRKHLAGRGIGTGIYYPLSLHEQECFRALGYARGDFPESERAAQETLALPIFPELTDEQIDAVAAAISAFYA